MYVHAHICFIIVFIVFIIIIVLLLYLFVIHYMILKIFHLTIE